MPGKATQSILKKLSADITEARELLDSSAAIVKSLERADVKDSENGDDIFEKTKDLVDRLKGKITSLHSCFYKHYDVQKNNTECRSESESQVESESERSVCQTSCLVDDSFNSIPDNIDTSIVSNENQSSDRLADAEANIDNEDLCNNIAHTNNVGIDNDVREEAEHNLSKSINETNAENEEDNTLGTDEICSRSGKTRDTSDNFNDATQSASVVTPPNVNKETETVSVAQDSIDDVNSENALDNTENLNKDNTDDNNIDPLNIDHNTTSNDTDKRDEIHESKSIKTETLVKIKCVDINKLLDPSVKSTDVVNNSVVVISDSDNDSSPRKHKKKLKANQTLVDFNNLPPCISVTPRKKVIVLDDSDSDAAVVQKNKEAGTKASRVSFNLHNSDSEMMARAKRNPKRKVVKDLANVSSLSENSTSRSDESHDDTVKTKKKSKVTRKTTPVNDSVLLEGQEDEKFALKAYVPITRIPAATLKANYEKKVLKLDIRRLTNLKNLKRSRRRNSESSDSTGKKKKEKKSRKNRNRSKNDNTENETASDTSVNDDPSDCSNLQDENNGSKLDPKTGEYQIETRLLDGINSDSSNGANDLHSDLEEQDKDSSTKKQGKDKKTRKEKDKESESKKDDEKSGNEDNDSDTEENRRKKKWRKNKLLTENITESDSDENFAKFMKKKDKEAEKKSDTEKSRSRKQLKRLKKQRRKNVLGSDSESSTRSRSVLSSDKSSSSDSEKDSEEEKKKRKPAKRRIKRVQDSSDSEDEDKSTRKNIRKVWKNDSLAESTIAAEKEEKERKMRIAERQKKYNQIFEADSLEKSSVDKVILDFNEETEEELLKVDPEIVKHLKPHQAKGIQFMWNTCFESLSRIKKSKGSGCILAHCMGLGKTLQIIALVHTLLTNEEKTGIRKILVVCPMGTVLNWVAEFKKWLPDEEVEVFELVTFKQNYERMYQVQEWERLGGALIIGYDMFRNLTNATNKRLNKKMRATFQTSLVDPGPDLVVCDEGHLLKNEKTSISIAMNRIKTMRRIVLTGTPLQNNMKEYFCMVQFVKPNLLGTYKEYLNRFVNPITNGQYTDSTPHDIQIMRKRSHVLHKLLDGIVQRKDYSVLAPFLPPKYEYVLFVALTEIQIKLYDYHMRERSRRNAGERGRSYLFVDFNEFQRICTHPRILLDKSIEEKRNMDKKDFLDDESEGSLKDFIDDDNDSDKSSNSGGSSKGSGSDQSEKERPPRKRITRATKDLNLISDSENDKPEEQPDPPEWWREFCTDDDLDNLLHSGKLTLLFEVLRYCEMIGDKVLIFSQSLYSLNLIEYFLNKVDEETQNGETNSFCGFSGSWSLGLDYFRLDGSSSCDSRAASCKKFNDTDNTRARLFLISTRAGGLGINLVAANRVIIFDVSWNPSHDTQSIYRVYRFGQTKPCYIYRFVTLGTMEMKIYERQVIKQAISKRVIDEQQIDRHYNQSDLAELYKFEPVPEEERPIPLVPKDVLLGELLQMDKKIYKYHEHQSLLENKVDEVLDEEERKAAWEEFENEKITRANTGTINNYPVQMLQVGIQSIIRKENPSWPGSAVTRESGLMFKRLLEEVQMGPSPIFQRVVAEIRLLQKAQENYYKMVQQQQALLQFQRQLAQQYAANRMPTPAYNNDRPVLPTSEFPASSALRQALVSRHPTEFIDLND